MEELEEIGNLINALTNRYNLVFEGYKKYKILMDDYFHRSNHLRHQIDKLEAKLKRKNNEL